ncbi:hypothetical protein GCM10009584_21770 [Ornithinimicrobium humiphilum]|uniref:Uncharacterized protein DUF222 n=1 Tax=Ornithinimicrobium humiphilum TaxID=125288 RepID=A0A543KN85_9MICO|nr:HNH endonuclease signature motif containing protein [Ornithinimicrobium humiphilum]TQM96529.1 uncharacterized protein DUF222 [Ornithinimicrobium humiphilum]
MAYRGAPSHPQGDSLQLGRGDHVPDPGDYVPDPVTPEEVAEAQRLAEEMLAQMGPEDDPDSPEYWQRFEDMLATMRSEPTDLPARDLASGLTGAEHSVEHATLSPDRLVQVLDDDLAAGLEAVGRVRAGLDALAVGLACEASARGLHTQAGLSLRDWVLVRCPWLTGADASALVAVVAAAQAPWGARLGEAARAGEVTLHRAARISRTLTRLTSSLAPDQQEAYASIATGAAADARISDRDLDVVCHKLLVDLLDEAPAREARRTAHEQRCVVRRPLGQGMVRYVLDAPERDAVLLDGILTGPLAKPQPAEDGARDERSAGQRGYDAFLTVMGRGLGHPGAPPSSSRGSVVLTVAVDPATGRPTGPATTSTGQVLDPQAVGRFACLGDVTPVVLGPLGEPLDLGRTRRLATPGQVKALYVRDGTCTYPGCSVPGTWCDAHHLVWWSRGGGTDLTNLALLCSRHHTLVHDEDLMATVTGGVVTWHV